jgi:hypothetical protein
MATARSPSSCAPGGVDRHWHSTARLSAGKPTFFTATAYLNERGKPYSAASINSMLPQKSCARALNRPERVKGEPIGRSLVTALFPGIEIAGG